jgi:NTE family protein
MGADVVIAVDLTPPLYDADELESAIEVSMQTFRISTLQNTVPQREALVPGRDVLLRPDVAAVPITDFRSLTATFSAGADIAQAASEDLAQWSLSREAYQAFKDGRTRVEQRPETLDFVRIEGAERMSSDALRGRLGLSPGEPLVAETLERALNRVFAMGLYQRVDYSLIQEDDTNGLLVEVTEKPWGPGLMSIGMAFGNDLERGRSSVTILATHRQTQLNGRGGELLFEFRLGEAQGAQVELFQPIDVGGRFFIAPRVDYQEESLEVAVLGAGEVSRGVREMNAAIALGAHWRDWGEFRVELVGGRVEERGADESPESDLSADVGAVLARFSVDLLDDASFPTSGSRGRVEVYRSAESLGADPTYTRLEGALLTALSKGRNTMVLEGRFGTAFSSDLPVHHDFALGGFQQLSGLRPRQLVGSRYALARATFRRKMATLNTTPAGGDLHLGFSLETGNAWSEQDYGGLDELKGGGSVFVAMETLLGPLVLAYGRATSGSDTLYLLIGRSF